MLYCIGNRAQGVCKIGYTADHTAIKRLKSLQTGNPFPLVILGRHIEGEYTDEIGLHNKFRGEKLMGEWFKITQEIAECFDFPLDPVDRLWAVALTYLQADAWEKTYTNGMVTVFSPSEQEAIGDAKLKAKFKGGCVQALAIEITPSVIAKAVALMPRADNPLPTSTFDHE